MAIGTITSLGIGSSLDLQGMLDAQRQADEAILGLKKDEIDTQTAVKDQLNSVLNQLLSMKTNCLNLSLSSNYLYRTTSVSEPEVVTATALDGAKTGSHRIETTRLASCSAYISQGASSSSASVYVPTAEESAQGFGDTDIVLAEGETIEIKYGPEDNPHTFTITGTAGGMTAADLVAAVNSDTENRDSQGNPLVTASTYEDEEGKTRIRIEAASGGTGEDSRVSVTGSESGTGFTPPVSEFSFTLGEDGAYSISVPAETTLDGLAERINNDENNPGVTATVVNTGTGDTPYQLILEADNSGEDSRITIVSEPPGLAMKEKNGSGYTMSGDQAVSFDTPVTIDGSNKTVVFQEDAGNGYSGGLTATIPEGEYHTPEALAQAVEEALENESRHNGNEKDYQVDIDPVTGKMVIGESGTLEGLRIDWENSTASTALGFSGTQSITPADASLNARVIVDGVSYQRQENHNQTGLIEGVTLSLYSTGVSNISVEANTDMVEQEIISLVETYNTLITEIDDNDDYDEDTEAWGTLARSGTARSLEQDLQALLSTTVDTGGSLTSLMDLGIEINRDGTISLDKDTLSRQVTENFEDVQALFLGSDTVTGLGDILNDEIGEYALSDGYINGEIDTIDDKILRLENYYTSEMERLDKKYEIMAQEYADLDAYLSQLASTRSYIESMMSPSED